jgi:RNA polymerase sigma factor (sigma-70 family)
MSPSPDDVMEQLPWVRALAARLVFDREHRGDLEQEIWHAALRSPPRDGVPLRAWLHGIGAHLAALLRRRDVRRQRREQAAVRAGHARDPAELAVHAETQQRLLGAVNALPDAMRDVVLLRFFEGLPPRAIAAELGVPIATVRTRLQRALARLREQLDADYGDRRAWTLALAALPRPRHVAAAAGVLPVLLAATWTTVKTHKLVAAAALLLLAAVPTALVLGADRHPPPPDHGVDAPVAAALGARARPVPPAGDVAADRGAREAASAVAGTLGGRVVDGDGAPIAGALLRRWPVWRADELVADGRATVAELETRSAPDGTFTLAAVAIEKHGVMIAAEHAGFVPIQERITVQVGQPATLVMLRTHEVPIEVEVVERGTGVAVPRFRVHGSSPLTDGPADAPWSGKRFVSPDDAVGRDGRWSGTARFLEGRRYDVWLKCAGAGRGEWADVADQPAVARQHPVPGQALRLRFEVELDQAERLAARVQRGRVVDAEHGRPIAGADVWIGAEGTGRARTVQTRADGSFVAALPRSGAPATVCVEHDDWQTEALRGARPDEELTFRLRPRASLRLRVVDGNGAAVPRAHLLVRARGDQSFHRRLRTGDDGVVELSALLADRYPVFVVPHGGAPDEHAIGGGTFTVEAGERRDEVLPIEPPDAVRVSGMLVGGPAGLAPLFVPYAAGGRWTPARMRGRAYDAGGLARGDYLVVVMAANEADKQLPAMLLPTVQVRGLGATAIDLQVPAGFVRGRAVAARDLAALRAVVVPDVPAGGLAADLLASAKLATAVGAPLAADGSFEVKHVADGAWRLQLRDGATVVAERAVTVVGSLDVGDWTVGR